VLGAVSIVCGASLQAWARRARSCSRCEMGPAAQKRGQGKGGKEEMSHSWADSKAAGRRL